MATLKQLPFIRLNTTDVLNSMKMKECSADTIGCYLYLLCVLHKQKVYGVFTVKGNPENITNIDFARSLDRHIPLPYECILSSINELAEEGVIIIEGNSLTQERMKKDSEISEKRSKSGKKGGVSASAKRKVDIAKPTAKKEEQVPSEEPIADPKLFEDSKDLRQELEESLISHFGYTESQFGPKRKVYRFAETLKTKKQIEYFAKQFKFYHEYKKASEEKLHSKFDTLIGTQSERWEDGAWDKENWEHKLNQYNQHHKKSTKFDRAQQSYNEATNPYEVK